MRNDKPDFLDFNCIISICYYGRSGSVFLQSLLDNHPDLIAFPGTYLMGYQDWFDSLSDREEGKCASKFLHDFHVLFDPEHVSDYPLPGSSSTSPGLIMNFHKAGPDENQHIKVNKIIFEKTLHALTNERKEESAPSFFKKLHIALAKAMNIQLTPESKIVFALHTPALDRAKFILNGFSNRKFIHVVREPVYSAFSLYKHYDSKGIKMGIFDIINAMNCYSPILGEEKNSCAVKLEDLHTNPEKTLNNICNYLDIKWSDTLLQSTFLGYKWHNLAGTDKVSGFNNTIISKTHSDCCSDIDRAKLAWLFRRVYKKWQYPLPSCQISFFDFLKPFQIEKTNSFLIILKTRFRFFKFILKHNAFIRKLFGRSRSILVRL